MLDQMRDVVVYIHGLVSNIDRSHRHEYEAIHEGVRSYGIDLPDLDGPDVIEVELWWDADLPYSRTANLAAAQRAIKRAAGSEVPARDRLTAPLMRGVRELVQYAWADAFFYTSEDGEKRTREDVWKQILYGVAHDEEVDLSIVCHSGGTLVAHDFLFYLFSNDREVSRTEYVDGDVWAEAEARWRIRRLVTMGSPLAPLMVRSTSLVDKFASDPGFRLDIAKLGFDRGTHAGADSRWLNLWDVHDMLSYPLAGLYGDDSRIRDLFPDVGDWPGSAHDKYWYSDRAHRMLAANWE